MRGLSPGALLLASLASCYNPDLSSGKFACAVDGDCPGSLLCRQVTGQGLRCVEPGGDTPGGTEDMASTDGSGGVDQGIGPVPTGCKDSSKAVRISDDVWGCRGGFGVGRAGDLCAGDFRWCGKSDDSKLQLGDACTRVSGFFLANQWAGDVDDRNDNQSYRMTCERLSSPYGWQGCGTEEGARVVTERQGPCVAVTTIMRCERGRGWTCEIPGMRYDGSGMGGGLCCRR